MGWHDDDDDVNVDDDDDDDDEDDDDDDNDEERDYEDKAADLTGKGGRLSWGLRQPPVKVSLNYYDYIRTMYWLFLFVNVNRTLL